MANEWRSNTVTSPGAGDVIVDTDAMASPANYFVSALVNASLAASFLFQHRNAANNASINEQEFNILANNAVAIPEFRVFLNTDERIRIVMRSALALGRVSCSLFFAQ